MKKNFGVLIDWPPVSLQQAANMIGMAVCEYDRVNVIRADTCCGEACLKVPLRVI